ncbi:MAG: outer membrane protein transport protein [Calditrichia bacterium]
MFKKLLLIALMMLLVPVGLQAAGTQITSAGARAVGLGGAFRGVANDWSTIYWNPAGMAMMNNQQFGTAVEFLNPVASLTPAQVNGRALHGYADFEVDATNKWFVVPSLGYIKPMGNLAFGLGVFAPFGLGAEWDLYNFPAGFNSNLEFPEKDLISDLKVITVMPSVAYKVNEQIAVGLALHLNYGAITIEQPKLIANPLLANPLTAPLVAAPFDYFPVYQTLEGTGFGFGANAGVLFKASDKLSIGANFRYYTDIKIDGKIKADLYAGDDQTTAATLDALAAAETDAEKKASLMQAAALYKGQKLPQLDDDDASADLPLPMEFGLGFAYRPNPKLLFSFDVNWSQWSSWDIIKLEDITDLSGAPYEAELVENWDDAIRYSAGLEYLAWQKEQKQLFLRLGYYNDPSVVPDETIRPTIPNTDTYNAFIYGLGYKMGNVSLDGMIEYIYIKDRDVKSWTFDASGSEENVAGNYSLRVLNIMVGLTYNFE